MQKSECGEWLQFACCLQPNVKPQPEDDGGESVSSPPTTAAGVSNVQVSPSIHAMPAVHQSCCHSTVLSNNRTLSSSFVACTFRSEPAYFTAADPPTCFCMQLWQQMQPAHHHQTSANIAACPPTLAGNVCSFACSYLCTGVHALFCWRHTPLLLQGNVSSDAPG